jgi:hypothetical protein
VERKLFIQERVSAARLKRKGSGSLAAKEPFSGSSAFKGPCRQRLLARACGSRLACSLNLGESASIVSGAARLRLAQLGQRVLVCRHGGDLVQGHAIIAGFVRRSFDGRFLPLLADSGHANQQGRCRSWKSRF